MHQELLSSIDFESSSPSSAFDHSAGVLSSLPSLEYGSFALGFRPFHTPLTPFHNLLKNLSFSSLASASSYVKECASRGHSLGLESCVPWPLICGDPYASLDCQLPKHKSRAPHPHNPPFGQKDGSSSHSVCPMLKSGLNEMTGKSLRNICYQDPHHSLVSLHDNNPLEQWERDIVPYIELAHKAMSRHFKCLKNSVVMQFKKNYELLSEKDAGTPGLTEEETPRLKMLDKILRQ
ncbi:hypothetical protein T459_02197 [Capsicum annuum]|uniref:Uncharacterized protein n=1 Tax=Capsicum annuum TaxID=4072 RepID=A0A2G3AJ99_CAPAN|nr:hypothetical protein T459_02197 [Capsicum annuum]